MFTFKRNLILTLGLTLIALLTAVQLISGQMPAPAAIAHPIDAARPDWPTAEVTSVLYLPNLMRGSGPNGELQLTLDAARDINPALSPDRQTIVFVSDRGGEWRLYRLSLQDGSIISLTQPGNAESAFSPDGAHVAFAAAYSGDYDLYMMNSDGSDLQRIIGYTGTHEQRPVFAPDGSAVLFGSNYGNPVGDIFSATLGSEPAHWTRLTTGRFPSISANGDTLAFHRLNGPLSELYLAHADGMQARRVMTDTTSIWYPIIEPDGSGIVFMSWRSNRAQLYVVNPAGAGLVKLSSQPDRDDNEPYLSLNGRWLAFSGNGDLYLRPHTSPLTQIGARGAMSATGRCDWEAGTLALGLAHAYRATGNIDDLARLRTWIDGCIPIKSGHIDQVNDGLLGNAALIAYQADHQAPQLAFAQEVADFLMNTAQRAPDGTLLHLQGQTLIWDDTLLSTVPFLIEMSKVSGNPLYLDEAISQTILHAGYLRDPGNGLYHHAAYLTGTLFAPTYWARGNGWALLAEVELLAAMPITHPQRATLLSYLQQQAAALKPLQDASGLWPTVVNRPDFYLESSGSALIGYALRRGARSGWLDAAQFEAAGEAALIGVWNLTAGNGMVGGVSGPTGPMIYEDWYNLIGTDELELYGQGAALLLASPLSY